MCGLIITFFTFIFYMLMFIHFMSLQIGFSLKFWVTFRTWIFEMLTWCVWCQFLTIWQRYSLEGQTNEQIEGKIDKMTDRQTEERTDIKTKGQPNRQKDRHSNRKANRHKTRQKRRTNRQKNRHINREIICHLIYTMIKKQNGW